MSLWDSSAKNLLDIQQLTRGSHLRMPRKQSRSQATYPAGYGPGLRRRRRRFAAGPSELLIAGNHGVHELLPAQAGALAGRIGNQPFDGCLPFGTPFGLAVTPPPNAVRSRCSSGLIGIRETGCQKATRLGLAHTWAMPYPQPVLQDNLPGSRHLGNASIRELAVFRGQRKGAAKGKQPLDDRLVVGQQFRRGIIQELVIFPSSQGGDKGTALLDGLGKVCQPALPEPAEDVAQWNRDVRTPKPR